LRQLGSNHFFRAKGIIVKVNIILIRDGKELTKEVLFNPFPD
jgi:hypothetical protein